MNCCRSPPSARHPPRPGARFRHRRAAPRRTWSTTSSPRTTITAVLTHHDRIVLAGARPADGPLTLGHLARAAQRVLPRTPRGRHRQRRRTRHGHRRRHEVRADHRRLPVRRTRRPRRRLRGTRAGVLRLLSAPRTPSFPTALVKPGEGNRLELGDQQTANRRTIDQYIHADGVQSCQVVLGVTTLHAGSTWNTMPAHTHDRRTECYLYFGLPETERIVHLLGEPEETRHLLVADRQAIISPSWSIHSGCRHVVVQLRLGDGRREPGVRRHGRCRRTGSAVTAASASKDRTALVTGARRGIGAAIAAGYAAAGAELILMARDAALEDTLEAIKQNGGGDATGGDRRLRRPGRGRGGRRRCWLEERRDRHPGQQRRHDPAGAGGRDHDRGLAARDRREPELHLGGDPTRSAPRWRNGVPARSSRSRRC